MKKSEMHKMQQYYVERIERMNGGAIDRLDWRNANAKTVSKRK